MNDKYDLIIGLEIHVQNNTESKMFCSCSNRYFQVKQNTLTCPVCLGLPGALPVPNRRAVELCILMGLATNCDIESEIRFDRKHYFYPDLPKGYQISQYDQPICSDGYVEFKVDGEDIKIDIERIHQEEDVAKSTHHTDNDGKEYSLIDYNKSGAPLIEIVSRPVIRSASVAKQYASTIRQIARYLNVSDGDMEKGQMRCEPNLSVQLKGSWEYVEGKIVAKKGFKLNPKVEIKNIGSISAVQKAIEYETERLISEIEAGKEIIQQTRGWNPEKGITEFQRSKESAQDYRYFPEPDIPIIELSESDIEKISAELVELPNEKIARFVKEYGLSEYDAEVLSTTIKTAQYFENTVKLLDSDIDTKLAAKEASNWITVTLFSLANTKSVDITELGISQQQLANLIRKVIDRKVLNSKAKEILINSVEQKKDLDELLEEGGEMISDDGKLEEIAKSVIEQNPQAVTDYNNGKEASLMFLLGQVMKETKGSADPVKVKDILIKLVK